MADTGGAGQWRGGCALRKDIEILNSTALLSISATGTGSRPMAYSVGERAASRNPS